MGKPKLFTIVCETCGARLSVRNLDAIGKILSCPRCDAMVEIRAPQGWQPDEGKSTQHPEAEPAAPLQEPSSQQASQEDLASEIPDSHSLSEQWAPPAQLRIRRIILGSAAGILLLLATSISWRYFSPSEQPEGTLPLSQNTTPAVPSSPTANGTNDDSARKSPNNDTNNESAFVNSTNNDPVAIQQIPGIGDTVLENDPSTGTIHKIDPQSPSAEDSNTRNAEPDNSHSNDKILSGSKLGNNETTAIKLPTTSLQTRLEMPIGNLHMEDVPLILVLRSLANAGNFHVSFSLAGLGEQGISLEQPVSMDLPAGTLEEVLSKLLNALGLRYVNEHEHVFIISPEYPPSHIYEKKYDIKGIFGPFVAAHSAQLLEFIQKGIAPDSWDHPEVELQLEPSGTLMLVKQKTHIQWRIGTLLSVLESVRQKPEDTGSPERSRIEAQALLERRITLNYPRPTPLMEILDQLEIESGLRIVLDRLAIDSLGSEHTTGTLQANNISLREALDHLLSPLGLAATLEPSSPLVVTSINAARDRLVTRAYFGEPSSIQQRKSLLDNSNIDWKLAGAIFTDPVSGTLIVSQTEAGHLAISKILTPPGE